MKSLLPLLALLITTSAAAMLPAPGTPGAPDDPRYCGEPTRDKNGVITRSAAVRAKFIRVWPKPLDGQVWYVDHVLPREAGGCDAVFNMQWLPAALKTCKAICKDRFERKIYATSPVEPPVRAPRPDHN